MEKKNKYINENALEMLISQSVFDSIFNYEKDTLIDCAEVCIDNVFDSEILKQIPLIKTILAIVNVGLHIKEKHFAIEFYKFLLKIKNNNISSEALREHRRVLTNDKKQYNKEMQMLMLFINDHKFDGQSERLANIYTRLIEGKIDWDLFIQLVDINSKVLDADIKVLLNINSKIIISKELHYIVNKLVSLGLVYQILNTWGSIEKLYDYFDSKNYDVSKLGKEFISCS